MPRLGLASAIALILVVETLALGLKGFDERRAQITATQTITHREALAVSEFISGKIAEVRQVLAISTVAGWSGERAARLQPQIDAVVTLADALTAAPGSRLNAAGEAASALLAAGDSVALTPDGDLVIVHKPVETTARLALVPARLWIPKAEGNREFSLLPQRLDGIQPDAVSAILACSPVTGGTLSACVKTPQPVFTQADLIRFAIYALLLAGPALAFLGLLRLVDQRASQSEAFEGQATRAGRMLATVLKEARAGIWSIAPGSNKMWLSHEAAQLIGVSREGHYGFSQIRDLVHRDEAPALQQSLETLKDRQFISQTFANGDRTAWLDIRGRLDPVNGEITGILLDVTDMRAAIARSNQAERRLKSALEGFSGPFALWDRNKRISYWNRAFAAVFNLDSVLRVGMSHETVSLSQASAIISRRKGNDENGTEIVCVTSGEWFKMVERTTNTGGMITMGLDVSADVRNEVELTRQRASLRSLVLELERSEGHAGELARKLNEEKLRAEKSANSKSAFLANMSHELRTPLNAINGFSEILADQMFGPLGDPRYVEYAGDILASGQHLLDMINDILDMAKVEAGKMTVDLQPIDLVEPVDAAIRMVRRKAEEKDIRLSFVANEGLPKVDADHRAIRQMILNLVSNAIKFTDPGGEIRVTIDRKGDFLRVAVRDNGVGIPQEALPRLGQPFEQVADTRDRNYDGTGLGLALTKSFAEMHGGRLTIASEEGRGTQVSFFLPIPRPARAEAFSAA